ncbi:hypothetical protein ACFQAQ_10015 [Novosphingobium resinovorum]
MTIFVAAIAMTKVPGDHASRARNAGKKERAGPKTSPVEVLGEDA